jgi:hypothetical protein
VPLLGQRKASVALSMTHENCHDFEPMKDQNDRTNCKYYCDRFVVLPIIFLVKRTQKIMFGLQRFSRDIASKKIMGAARA